MARIDTFTFRVNQGEREILERLAQRLQRTQSDALRWLLREAMRELEMAPVEAAKYDQEQRSEGRDEQ